MTKFCALIPLLVAAPAVWGCVGTKPVQSSAGEGGSGAVGTGTGGSGATTGTGGSHVTGAGGSSVTTGTGGGGGDVGPAPDAGTQNCGLYQFQPTPKAADIMMVLDRSGSMQDVPDGAPSGSPSKWSVVIPSLMSVVASTQDSISWGLKAFPEASTDGLSDCSVAVTKAIDVQVAAKDGTMMNSTITATTPNGNGTPTPDAITAAANYLATLTDANPKYLLLATDGEPDCVGTTKDSSSAGTAAVTAVGNALKAGFPTFVVGIVTTKQSAITELNLMAKAGGEPIANTNPLSNHFYETDLASDPTELTTALKAITGQISTCLFPLGSAPPILNDGTKVGVYVGSNMTRIPYDPTKATGWAYTDTNDTAIQIFGSWCDMIQAAGAGAVQIIFGCPSINPPG